ncbi:MAG: hypothetical protein ACREPK_01510 [Rhodanobacteraceae bacterium]
MNDKQPAPDESPPRRKRQRWLRHDGIDLGDAIVQIFAVVVGILLALFINDWVTKRQQRATASAAQRAIRAELTHNRNATHSDVTILYAAATKLLDLPEKGNQHLRTCDEWKPMASVGVPDWTDAAYQIALSTHALSYLPFKRAELIAQEYGAQDTFKQLAFPRLIHVLAQPHSREECAMALVSFANLEKSMSTVYAYLIGPDKTKWPVPPSTSPIPPPASK